MRPGAARCDRVRVRRLRSGRGGPVDPRRGRDPRHPAARPAPLRAASLPEDTALLLEARRRVLDLPRDDTGPSRTPPRPLMDEARRRFGDERVEQIAAWRDEASSRELSNDHRQRRLGRRRIRVPRGATQADHRAVREALFSILGDLSGGAGPRPLLRERRTRDRGALRGAAEATLVDTRRARRARQPRAARTLGRARTVA